jgi:hypothetical protein
MERINKEVNENNKKLLNEITKIYTKLSKNLNDSYITGKKEAFEEILNYLLTQQQNLKHIDNNSFYNFLIQKRTKAKIALKDKNNNNDSDLEYFNNINIENKLNNNFDINKKKYHKNIIFDLINDNYNNMNNNNDIFPTSVYNLIKNNNNINNNSNNNNYNNSNILNNLKSDEEDDDISMTNLNIHNNSFNVPNKGTFKRKK